MGETPEAPAAETATEPTETTPEPEAAKPADDWESNDGKGGKKAVLADLASERKIRKELEKRLQVLENTQKSDLEKATSSAEREKTRAESAEQELTRYKVIAATGLPPELQEFLPAGADEDALTEKATKLIEALGSKPGTPKPDPSQGAKGSGPSIDARIAEAQRNGDFKTVIKLQNDRLAELARKQK